MLETCGCAGKGVYLPGSSLEVLSKAGPNAGREGTPDANDIPRSLVRPARGRGGVVADRPDRPRGPRQMLAAALQAEVDAYIEQIAGERDQEGRRLVVRNGSAEPRTMLTSAGAVEVTAPRVNDKRTDPGTGERLRFSSAILPPWARKTPQVSDVLPLLYLHGSSSGDFVPALASSSARRRDCPPR